MKRELPVRVLMPKVNAEGEIEVEVETRIVRLPIRREDRHLLQRRLDEPNRG